MIGVNPQQLRAAVTPRKGRVSRNNTVNKSKEINQVTPRKGRVSRNFAVIAHFIVLGVTPRKGRVSRNIQGSLRINQWEGHASQGACE